MNPVLSKISRIINSKYATRTKLSKIRNCFYKVGFCPNLDIVPSLDRSNVYFAFIDNRECEFIYEKGKVQSDKLTPFEKEQICAKLNTLHWEKHQD